MRFTNLSLLALVIGLTLTGLYGLFWTSTPWMYTIHRVAGWALVALAPWKIAISISSLRRGLKPNIDRGLVVLVSLLLALVTLTVLALALLWKGRFGPESYWLRQTAIAWHWMLALGLLAPLAVHVWRRWPKPKKVDFASRRAFIRMAVIVGLGLGGYFAAEAIARSRARPDSPNRFTGSRRANSFSGNDYPVTQTIPARLDQIDPAAWRLRISIKGRERMVLAYPELLAMATVEKTAAIDCTLGWYSTQVWRGVPLVDLLVRAGMEKTPAGVRFTSVTGYAHVLPYEEAKDVLLATHVGGEALLPDHGFPLRAVVPSRRGWFWVKWLAKIELVDAFNEIE